MASRSCVTSTPNPSRAWLIPLPRNAYCVIPSAVFAGRICICIRSCSAEFRRLCSFSGVLLIDCLSERIPYNSPMPIVTFLRGVNVGGHRTFRPSLLADKLHHLDLVNIGAAGTFVIRKPVSQTLLHSALRKHLPFETHIMMCPSRELLAAV